MPSFVDPPARERIIVALDVPTVDEALRIVERLDNVSFFKIGWQLFWACVTAGSLPDLLKGLHRQGRKVFIDLKVPPDIENTIGSMIGDLTEMNAKSETNVKFLTLNEQMPIKAIGVARAARGSEAEPKLLMVPYLSSLDRQDMGEIYGRNPVEFESFLLDRAETAITAGCDGLIASGDAIALFRQRYPKPEVIIVSPGIRPVGASHDDHKRFTTPTQAVKAGADYLVVGRPILKDQNPHDAANRIIEEIDVASRSTAH